MKKVGIITLYKDNFGSILQAYSTYQFIRSLGYETVLLQIKNSKTLFDKVKYISNIIIKCIQYPNFLPEKLLLKKAIKRDIKLLSNGTREKMNMFVNSVFQVEIVEKNSLRSLNSQFDYFITGSDQVWNGYDSFKYLTFADKDKKIAFAPSFGTYEIKEYFRKDIKKALEDFKELSVREETGLQIIKQLTGKNAIRLPDPTLLLTKDEWKNFAANGEKKKNYILLHFLNKPSELAIRSINEYLKKHGCMAYSICNKYSDYNQLINFEFIDINPYDYVSLISNANFVFTDSFHSTLFSLNLETQFLTFDRQYLHENSQSSRIVDLLDRVDMQERFIVEDRNIQELNTWNSDELFKEERMNIRKYLEKALGR